MRLALIITVLFALGACDRKAEAPAGNQQAVIDKANQDVIAAEAAAAPPPAETATPAP